MNDILRRNIERLPREMRERIQRTSAPASLVVREAKDGCPVIGIRKGDRDVLFHSGYSPAREAERIAAAVPAGSFVVAFGFGAGHHLRALLAAGSRVLAIEPDVALLRAALERFDFSRSLANRTLWLSVGTPSQTAREIQTGFVPGIDQRLSTIDLPGRVGVDNELFGSYRDRIQTVIDDYASDISTQATFGKRWMSQTLGNLVYLAKSHQTVSQLPQLGGVTACVAAAGPSLESHIGWILSRRRQLVLLAVDTALPVLAFHGISPDLVVSVDCQLASYHHYLSASPVETTAAIELSAPGALFERPSGIVPIGSSHPFHRFLQAHSLPIATIATGSGNVTGATSEIARTIGAGNIVLAGVDSSYPGGNLYPRGSYAHRYFHTRARRLGAAETLMREFFWSRGELEQEDGRWVTPQLRFYHAHLRRLLSGMSIPVYELPGAGWPLGFPEPENSAIVSNRADVMKSEPAPIDRFQVKNTLERFLNLVAAIEGRESLAQAFAREATHKAAASVLPVVLNVSKEVPSEPHDEHVRAAVAWVRGRVERAIDDLVG